MTGRGVTESVVEQAALAWFESLGYTVRAGPDIASDGLTPERGSYTDVILHGRLGQALAQPNPTLPAEALGLVELKNAAAENATIWTAFQQLQTYKGELSDLFSFNALLVVSDGVVDIFAAAGLEKPDISILPEEFLAEVRGMPQRNLAVELLRKLLTGEIRTRRAKSVVQARSFAEMLEQALRRYENRAIEAAQVIEELLDLAREMREADRRGEDLGLTEDEMAFYDAGDERQRRQGAR